MKHKTRKGCKTPRKKTRRIRIQRGGALINSIEDGVIVGEYDDVTGMGRANYKIGTYEGHFLNGNLDGQGKLTYANGSTYEGEWRDNQMDGQGKMTFVDGDVYEGEWRDDQMNGQGKMTYANGDIYEGQWLNSKKNGQGKMTYDNRDVYQGEWHNDEMTNGVVTFVSGNVWKGEFKNGAMTNGVLTFTNGSVYEGEFNNGEMNGQGIMRYANGDVYEGGWSANHCHGRGKMTYANGDVYVGPWHYDNRHGADGKMTYASDRCVYEGEWWNDKMHGDGAMTRDDGSTIYEGLWRGNQENPLFNPDTGALADNTEYNARRPPKIFPISDNMLFQTDTYKYKYHDMMELQDRLVLEALEEDHDAIALKVNRTYYVVSRRDIGRVANNKNFIQYECPIIVDLDVNPRDLERVIKTEPYLSINGMGVELGGVVPLFDIWSAIKSGHRAFELVGTRRVLLSTASHNTMFAYGSLVSSNHCQSGIPATVYELQMLRIASNPRIKPKSHANRFRVKNNGTKKLNRIINYMRGVRKQSHVRKQSLGR